MINAGVILFFVALNWAASFDLITKPHGVYAQLALIWMFIFIIYWRQYRREHGPKETSLNEQEKET